MRSEVFGVAFAAACLFAAMAFAAPWANPIVKMGRLNSPLVETTPFVFKDRLYRLESWQKFWEMPGPPPPGTAFHDDSVRVCDVEANKLVSTALTNHAFASALVWNGRVYVFSGNYGKDKPWRQITEIDMTSSEDLVHWTEPKTVLRAEANEQLFNVAVCRGKDGFVLLCETNDPAYVPFTFKYFASDDLENWRAIPNALYGREKYVGGPALYYEGDWYYTLYLQDLGGKWETRIARSKDLVHWEDAPAGRAVVTFDSSQKKLPLRPPELPEVNASDVELCEWPTGKTFMYFSGSDQQVAGDLQWAKFDGTPRKLLEHFFAEPGAVPVPNARQHAYQENQLGAFMHFGTATFSNGEMLASPAASVFDPKALNAEQWVTTAKVMGAKHVVLTAKHHGGFCLWPTKTTDYSVKSSPWREGKGDVVRDFVDAARKHGLAPGLYFSAGDFHFPCTSTPDPMGERKLIGDREKYFPIMLAQLRELLTNYGPLCVVWFDGAYDPIGWDVRDASGKPAGNEYWDRVVSLVRELQPSAAIFGSTRPDVRWCGNEEGLASYPLWNVLQKGEGPANYLPEHTHGYLVPEADVFTRPNWFWTAGTDDKIKSMDAMLDIYYRSIGHGANLLINLTPDNRGLIPEAEVKRMSDVGAEIQRRFAKPIASTSSDGRWGEGQTLDLDLPANASIDHVVIEEDLSHGQRVTAYEIVARDGNAWKPLAKGQSIGRKHIHRTERIKTSTLRLRIIESQPLPKIRRFEVFDTARR